MNLNQVPLMAAYGLALCLAQPALAQIAKTPVGTVDATIDGTSYSGETLEIPSEGTSTAEFQAFGPVTSISIQAHDPMVESSMHNVLSIEISIMGTDASASIMETSVSWWPEGMGEPFYHSEGSEAELEIDLHSLSFENGAAGIAGSFSARICQKESFFAGADMNDCLPLEGSFDTALRNAN